jgi:hypothetical protein
VNRLRKQEPILFYDENILYEDELADNGTAMLLIRLVSVQLYFYYYKEQALTPQIESDANLLSSFTKILSKSG